ncbi:MAG: DUF423 domain-containing protein [Proteobacteria bacterium]|nr:DUF423 domain-containing protein [Pseudomonadota bacterium]
MNFSIIAGAISGGTAVGLGAVGSHLIKPLVPIENFSFYKTAILYQFVHAILLIIIGNLSLNGRSTLLQFAGFSAVAGIVFFSGNIYLNIYFLLNEIIRPTWLGPVTPIGGIFFILSWALILISEVLNKRSIR